MRIQSISQAIMIALDEYFILQKNLDRVSGLYKLIVSEVESAVISKVMQMTHYNKKLSAKILGISRNTLNAKIKMFRLRSSV